MSSKEPVIGDPPTCGEQPARLCQHRISDAGLTAIGRLVRATSEIEDCLECIIIKLAKIDETRKVALLGRTPYSAKVGIARTLAKVAGADEAVKLRKAFNNHLEKLVKYRNIIVHGAYLGSTRPGEWVFQSRDVDDISDGRIRMPCFVFTTRQIEEWATAGECYVTLFEKMFQLHALRDRSSQLDLNSRRADQMPQRPTSKP